MERSSLVLSIKRIAVRMTRMLRDQHLHLHSQKYIFQMSFLSEISLKYILEYIQMFMSTLTPMFIHWLQGSDTYSTYNKSVYQEKKNYLKEKYNFTIILVCHIKNRIGYFGNSCNIVFYAIRFLNYKMCLFSHILIYSAVDTNKIKQGR